MKPIDQGSMFASKGKRRYHTIKTVRNKLYLKYLPSLI
jgi:hypothetical protein